MEQSGWRAELRRRYEEFWLLPQARSSQHSTSRARAHSRRRWRLPRGIWPLVPIVAAVGVLLVALARSNLGPYGTLGGYVRFGVVRSIAASWRVPIAGSDTGQASTWVGVQGASGRSPFIQVGTLEESGSSNEAFWSDDDHHFRAVVLGAVNGGDLVTATLRRTPGRWSVSLYDHTLGIGMTATSTDGAHASFGVAEWLQEDPVNPQTGQRAAYPVRATVRFEGLSVNGRPPLYGSLYSQWLSVPGGSNFAPTALSNDSFRIVKARLSAPAARYLSEAARGDRAYESLAAQIRRWGPRTSWATVHVELAPYLAALRAADREFARGWPRAARPALAGLIARQRQLIAQLARLPHDAPRIRASLLAATRRESAAVHRVRRALGAPEFEP